MEAIRHLQKRYCGGALSLAVVLSLVVYLAGWPTVTRGLLLGALFSALNFALLGKTMAQKLAGSHRRNTLIAIAAQVGRYLLWGVPVVMAVKMPPVDLPATIAGLFMVPIFIIADSVFNLLRGDQSPLS
jgi:ATP synthase protein I